MRSCWISIIKGPFLGPLPSDKGSVGLWVPILMVVYNAVVMGFRMIPSWGPILGHHMIYFDMYCHSGIRSMFMYLGDPGSAFFGRDYLITWCGFP